MLTDNFLGTSFRIHLNGRQIVGAINSKVDRKGMGGINFIFTSDSSETFLLGNSANIPGSKSYLKDLKPIIEEYGIEKLH